MQDSREPESVCRACVGTKYTTALGTAAGQVTRKWAENFDADSKKTAATANNWPGDSVSA